MSLAALVLAAGKGTRMRSKLPKVLHPVGGVPMVAHVVQRALERRCDPIVVVIDAEGRRVRESLSARFPGKPIIFAVQEQQLGTGDAARVGLEAIPKFEGPILILCGDVPLISSATLGRMQRALGRHAVAVLTATLTNPSGYGRIVRDGRLVASIVEDRDASEAEKRIAEINTGIYLCTSTLLRATLSKLTRNNAQHEFYLTDIVAEAKDKGGAIAVAAAVSYEVQGVNTRLQLAEAEQNLRYQRVLELIEQGVFVQDPDSLHLDADVRVDRDAVLGVNVQLRGATRVQSGAVIEGPAVIRNSTIEKGAHVHGFSHLDGARVGQDAQVGPFARLRPEAVLDAGSRVGNFVEMKKTRLGRGAKANHLAYLGDARIGADSNIGAGTITCNYDGQSKHPTHVGKGVFVGSNSTLVAPVRVNDGAYVAAGSTVTRDVPADALAFGRARQENREGYAKRLRERLGTKAKPAAKREE